MNYAHLARAENHEETVCGIPWEPWQEPMPSNDEIGWERLSPAVRALVRDSDRQWRESQPHTVTLCPACQRTGLRPDV